ncbi:MAG: hypothetical protein A2283_10555 [Lentisphaerae bacterium RIFOXYA12_FULL_48_11]|nr:MAG: hypothetical protein A2283_10555 [Lentisphaerae bacterium RIFOXYA12_FULL_48_11]
MDCRLVNITSGMSEMYPLHEGVTTIGRESDNKIQVLRANISRHHAKITNMPSVCQVEDLDSINGTFVDGERIKSMVLKHGNEVRFGDEVFRFEAQGSVGSDDVMFMQRDYSVRAQMDTVRIQQKAPETKIMAPVSKLSPLRPKKKD